MNDGPIGKCTCYSWPWLFKTIYVHAVGYMELHVSYFVLTSSFLMAFDKVRDCTAVHSHEGTKATILVSISMIHILLVYYW